MAGLEITGSVGGGLIQYSDGSSDQAFRQGRSGEMMVSELLPKYYELTKRGMVYVASSPAVGTASMAAANVSPLAAGTGQPVVGLYNPLGSGVDLVILKAWMDAISGTPGGSVVWNVIPPAAGITAAGAQGLNAYTCQPGGKGKVFNNAALTGSPVATLLRPLMGENTTAIGTGQELQVEYVDGDIIVQPGAFAGLAVAAAGTTWVLLGGLAWAELPA